MEGVGEQGEESQREVMGLTDEEGALKLTIGLKRKMGLSRQRRGL